MPRAGSWPHCSTARESEVAKGRICRFEHPSINRRSRRSVSEVVTGILYQHGLLKRAAEAERSNRTRLHVARSEPLLDDALYLLTLQRFVSEEIVDDRC